MALDAIIIRGDGALADTEDLRQRTFADAFAEAGYKWVFDRNEFAQSRKLGGTLERMTFFVRCYLRWRPETPDMQHLVSAMQRRAQKMFSELVARVELDPRPGMRDLVIAAREDGIRLGLVTALSPADARSLLANVFGGLSEGAFACISASEAANQTGEAKQLYQRIPEALETAPCNCFVIEASAEGADAARQAGLRVLELSCAGGNGSKPRAGMIGELSDLLGHPVKGPLTEDERTDLIRALQRLHAGDEEHKPAASRGFAMRVSDILKAKGTAVKRIAAQTTIRALAAALKAEAVGAMVVDDGQGKVLGIISERDLAHGLANFGGDLASMTVADLMTKNVVTCAPEDKVADVSKIMTQRRFRHMPVVQDGQLVGMISIGDVLKHRVDEVQLEASVLRDFALSRR